MPGEMGCLQVYTGNGKGKTTASIGLSIRASGADLRVMIIQFMKMGDYGEVRTLENMDNVEVRQFGRGPFVDSGDPDPLDREAARMALELAKEVLHSREKDLVILDEFNVALDIGLITMEEALDLIDNRPDDVELVLTGRNASDEIIYRADLVTEMKEVKHPFKYGMKARKGIEF